MSSGYGINGGPSRCFEFWQDFRKCYLNAESPAECKLAKDDYFECLHHTKEVSLETNKLDRALTIKERTIERQHEESKRAREAAKKGGLGAVGLGFIEPQAEAKA
ncbi:hypothetical protein MCUN1_000976 [Malassezia cuniculi]|uniref:NADH dehydrogenase [ubiquinone] iron-sulfur protein 5 n=1 Tax=Malassezia cuniculi TaxID=948313 RepID=A0AAF0J5J8_9BASI|nr:hypothetical protein MCUN1_000976 [Malassezia cuniculi]